MNEISNRIPIDTAELILYCSELRKTLDFYIEGLSFKLHTIFPADDPRVAVISGFGMRIRLEVGDTGSSEGIVVRLNCDIPQSDERTITAPNGVRFMLVQGNPPLILPEVRSKFAINRFDEKADWIIGRAGMRYRNLVPDRAGGYMIASHIHVPDAGPVPDYVHFHNIHFQMIYCYKGWARLVYEDQGEPFIFREGDCVLQPPLIRHRVLESSGNLEVVEISSPAEHETHSDLELKLPTPVIDSKREFSGQRFVHHKSSTADWSSWQLDGFEFRDTGIFEATNGIANVKIVRGVLNFNTQRTARNYAKLLFVFILKGSLSLRIDNEDHQPLSEGDSYVIPTGGMLALSECSNGTEFLAVEFL